MNSCYRSSKRLSIFLLHSFLIAGVLFPVSAGSKTPDKDKTPVYSPELTVRRAAGPIKVDGYIEDAGWKGAAKADRFAEHNPGDQTIPEVDTEVLITYDDLNLYVAWICYDDPDEVRAFMCERDDIFQGDYVILAIDTYGEATVAYEIAANPYGIPGDLLYSSNFGEDGSYDMIYESEGGSLSSDGSSRWRYRSKACVSPIRRTRSGRSISGVTALENRGSSIRGPLTTAMSLAGPASGGRSKVFPA